MRDDDSGVGGQGPQGGEGPHVIRLRGPWQSGDGGRVKLPSTWAEALGDVALASILRRFHPPTNLQATSQVLLRVESPHKVERILLNDSQIADGADLSGLLVESNRLKVQLARRHSDQPILEAWLEIF